MISSIRAYHPRGWLTAITARGASTTEDRVILIASYGSGRIDKPGARHLLRHACVTHMLGNGRTSAKSRTCSVTRLATTGIYTHVAIDKLQKIHAATHPAGKLARSSTTDPEG